MSTTGDERKDAKNRDKPKQPDVNEVAKRIVDKSTHDNTKEHIKDS
jgi:hypothetical protein